MHKARRICNLAVVWFITGLWHGADFNFILWGIGYFLLLIIEKYVIHPEKFKRKLTIWGYRIVTFILVNILWVGFYSTGGILGIKKWAKYCLVLLGLRGNPFWGDGSIVFYLGEYWLVFFLAIVFAVPIIPKLKEKFLNRFRSNIVIDIGYILVYMFIFLYGVAMLVSGANNPFMYFNF